jgi:hypothetical protein
MARRGAGTLLVPVTRAAPAPLRPGSGEEAIARRAGLDLAREVPAAADWVAGLDGPLVLGNYVYADGAANVAVCAAADALTARLQAARSDLALAFLVTPTDVYAVPAEAVAHSVRAYASRARAAKLAGRPLRTLSGGRLLRRAYAPGADPGICDSLVSQQGPNYALAKRLQRWRATVAREMGTTVSLNIAPPTRTRSVVKNRALAAAYAGAHRFGAEVFESATTRALMAALLVHDLYAAGRRTRSRGRTRHMPPRTAGCGASPTRPAARWASPRCSATAQRDPDRVRHHQLPAQEAARPARRSRQITIGASNGAPHGLAIAADRRFRIPPQRTRIARVSVVLGGVQTFEGSGRSLQLLRRLRTMARSGLTKEARKIGPNGP